MEILLANPLYLPYYGGTEKVIYQIGRRLAHKYDISILTSQLENTHALDEEDGMIIHRLPAKVLYKTPYPLPPPVPIVPGVNEWMKKNVSHYSIIHMHNRYFFNTLFGGIVKKGKKKLCLTIHNARTEGIDLATDFVGSVWDDVLAKRLMRKCDGIAGVSTSALESAIPKDYSGLKRTIYNGVDEKVFKPGKGRWKDELGIDGNMVLTNARLIVQKGVRYLIDSMTEVDGELVVFGRGPLEKQLRKRAAEKNVTVHFVSQRMSDEELADLYRSADVFAMPSLYDPCPLALLEAMGTGLPCVVTNAGGLKELIRDKIDGFVVAPRDPGAMASRLNLVLGNEEMAREMSKNIRKRVLDNFTWDRVANEYDKFYEEMLE